MYNNKFYGYVINSAIKAKKAQNEEEPDFRKVGLLGIINYMYSENPNKKYYGLD